MNKTNIKSEIRIETSKGKGLVCSFPNSLSVREHGLPKSRALMRQLLDYKYKEGVFLSGNPQALYAALCIMEGLIRESIIDENTNFQGEYQLRKTQFKPFTMTRTQASENFRVSIRNFDIAKKALEDLGLIWLEESRHPHQDEDGETYRYSHQGMTFTATPKLEREKFFFTFSDFFIPLNGLPIIDPECFVRILENGNRSLWIPVLQQYIEIETTNAA